MKRNKLSVILCTALSAFVLLSNVFATCIMSEAATKKISGNGKSITISTQFDFRNWQQTDSPWCDYVVAGQTNKLETTGAGIFALVNSVYYAVDYFMAPSDLSAWANAVGGYNGIETNASTLYTSFFENLGSQLHLTATDTTGKFKVIQNIDSSSKSMLVQRLKNDVVFIAHVNNHFVAIVDYNSKTDKFLVWDSLAGSLDNGNAGYGTARAGITHTSGDWFTWEQIRGSLKNSKGESGKFTVDYVIPLVLTEGNQEHYVARTDLMFGTNKLQVSGECCNFTPVDFGANGGKKLTFKGSYTSSSTNPSSIGYQVDGGAVMWVDSALTTPSSATKAKGDKMAGSGSYTKDFSVDVAVTDSTKSVNILIACGGERRVIWTALAQNNTTTGTVYTGKTPVTTQKATTAPTATPKATAKITVKPTEKASAKPTNAPSTAPTETQGVITTDAPGEIATEAPNENPEETALPPIAETETPDNTAEATAEIDVDPTEAPETTEAVDNTEAPSAETEAPSDPTASNDGTNKKAKGCKLLISGSIPTMLILLIAGTVVLNKKKD